MGFSSLVDDIIPANADHQGGTQTSVDLIVIHGTVSACVPGGARGNAHYFQDPDAGGAAHYICDPGEIIGSVDETRVAHHAPPNTGSVGIELCDWQGFGPSGDVNLWADQPHKDMLGRAAPLVRDVAGRWGVKLEWRSTDDLIAGRRDGITGHFCVAQAYHKTNHTDPGPYFPIDSFMALVRGDTIHVPVPPILEDEVFIAEFNDQPGTLWLVYVEPQSRANGNDNDPTARYGTRTRVVNPDWFWTLAGSGIPVRSGRLNGMGLYRETV